MNGSGFELDHLFVAMSRTASEVIELLDRGFAEAPPNAHTGQGTACRRIFFENAYLEFIWLEDRLQASAPPIDRTGLAARAGCEEGVSRLGVALRSREEREFVSPVATWLYKAPYLPDGMAVPVGDNSNVWKEPLLFFIPWQRRWSGDRAAHPNGTRRVTNVSVTVPEHREPSPQLRWLQESRCVRIKTGPSELLEVELDGGQRGESVTLIPSAPLSLNW